MAYDSPKLAGYTFNHPPKPSDVSWEPMLAKHKLSDGATVIYNKGFKLVGKLEWGKSGWIDQDDYSNITVMFNELTGTALFYPRPNTYPTRSFKVHITNDFNFVPHDDLLNKGGKQLYEGSIVFESSIGELTATAVEIF